MKYIRKIFENKTINLKDEFQSVLDLVGSDFHIYVENNKISINLQIGIRTDDISQFEEVVELQEKALEILKDCLHVAKRLKDDGSQIALTYKNSLIMITIVETDINIENAFKISIDPDGNEHEIDIDQNNLFTYFKNKLGVSVQNVGENSYWDKGDNLITNITIKLSDKIDSKKLELFKKELNEIKTKDRWDEDIMLEDIIYSIYYSDDIRVNSIIIEINASVDLE